MKKKCLRAIKHNKAVTDIPIVTLSSSVDCQDKKDCLRASASIYLVKTQSFDALMNTLRSLGIKTAD